MSEYIKKDDVIKIVSDMRGLCRQDVLQDTIKSIEALENQKSFIAEIEKIKAEFDNDLNLYKNEYDSTYNCSLDYIKGIITCKTIIDKHIEELKGE